MKCGTCEKDIIGDAVLFGGEFHHKACNEAGNPVMLCEGCKEPITDRCKIVRDKAYHEECVPDRSLLELLDRFPHVDSKLLASLYGKTGYSIAEIENRLRSEWCVIMMSKLDEPFINGCATKEEIKKCIETTHVEEESGGFIDEHWVEVVFNKGVKVDL